MHVRVSTARLAAALTALALSGCPSSPLDRGPAAPGNHAPVASADEALVRHRGEVSIPVLANDWDQDGDMLFVADVGPPLHGTVERMFLYSPGTVVYRPVPDYVGEDSFTYTVGDGRDGYATGSVHVTVAANAPPTAFAVQAGSVPEDSGLVVVLSGDDLEDPSYALRVEIVTPPASGTLDVSSGAAPLAVTYSPNADWFGADSFTYRVLDSDGAASSPATVSLSVWAVDDRPVATSVPPLVTDEDVPVVFTLTGEDVDTPAQFLVAELSTGPRHGSVTFDGDRHIPAVARYMPEANWSGTDGFAFSLYDLSAGRSSLPVAVTVTVNAVNDPPAASPVSRWVSEDGAVTVPLTGSDPESPEGSLRVEVLTLPSHGTLAGGTSGAAPLAVTYTPERDWSGTDRFAFRVVDPQGALSDPAEATVTVSPVNDPPVATPLEPLVADEDLTVGFVLTGTDPDDAVSALVVTIVTPPAHGTVSPASGPAPLASTYTPAPGWSGSDSFSFRVRDLAGALSAVVTVPVTVNSVQDAPIAVDDAAPACAGGSARIRVLRNDSDPDGDPLAISSVTQGALGCVAVDGDAVIYTALGAAGVDAFTYTVTDGGRNATATVTVTVFDPTVTSLLPSSGTTGGPLQLFGRCLGETPGTVTIGGRPAAVTTWTKNYVVATIPQDFQPGLHEVVVSPPGAAPATAAYEIVPWIGHVEPYYAAPGEAQSILGDAFVTPAGTVGYDAVVAAVDGWTNTVLQSRLPAAGRWSLGATTSGGATTNAYPVTGAGPDTWWSERVPAGRYDHTAVWTGTEVIVFGGVRASGAFLQDGGRYDPRHDAWLPITSDGRREGAAAIIYPPRARHTAVWTGKEMIAWGGVTTGGGATNTGFRYDPAVDRTTPTATFAAPTARERHGAVWTGSRMLVWGGVAYSTTALGDGASYDPVNDRWTSMSAIGAPSPRYGHATAWTGVEMIVWGGSDYVSALGTGARYDPAADRWRTMSTVGAPAPRSAMVAVWTGEELIVWGGNASGAYLADGARYDPAADEWRPLPSLGAPAGRSNARAVWTGRELVVWGGRNGAGALASGARYDPVADAWAPMDGGTAPLARESHTAVWTGDELIVWGGVNGLESGGRYSPAADRWNPMRSGTPGEPAPRRDHAWACLPGGDLVVWGGNVTGLGDVATGARYSVVSGTWTPLPDAGAPSQREGATAVWTGTHLLVWGGKTVVGSSTTYLRDGARYDPALDEWTALASTGAPSARSGHTATWAGGRMVVFGGRNASTALGDGAVYDAATDTWEALPTLNAPQARQLHTAVAAGDEVIVWGGETISGATLATGARYDVPSFAWITLPAGPSARSRHTAVWTGTSMIVAGGVPSGSTNGLWSGARFFPDLGAWGAMPDAPYGFLSHGAVWTGSQMVVWGGTATLGPFRYDLAARAWTSGARADAPALRDRPSMCWTGTDVVVWGGASGSAGTGGLGRYRP